MAGKQTDRTSNAGFTVMTWIMAIEDLLVPRIPRRARSFGLQPGMVVVDYGCGPGRYSVQFARIVGPVATGMPDRVADVVCAIDMFHRIQDPSALLREIHRITKEDGFLILDDGHQPRSMTLRKIRDSGFWTVGEQTGDHLKCLPVKRS